MKIDDLLKLAEERYQSHNIQEATNILLRVLKIDPYNFNALFSLGLITCQLGERKTGIDLLQNAIRINPTNAETHYQLGMVLHEEKQFEEAIFHYQKVLEINPNFTDAYDRLMQIKKQALQYLSSGHLYDGWKLFWAIEDVKWQYYSTKPLWTGFNIAGCDIFLHAQGGFGDTIQFIRYVPLIEKLGARIILACQKELATLLNTVQGIDKIIVPGDMTPEYDVHCPLYRLPYIFISQNISISADIPYITVSPLLVNKFREIIKGDNSKMRVGIVWSGNPYNTTDYYRSCSFKTVRPLLEDQDIIFYSLQISEDVKQSRGLSNSNNFFNYTHLINDFADTAAIIENLDLVISVDTAVAHLAGALGKPVWILIPYESDWRWIRNRKDTPWYPTMKIFRQKTSGDWSTLIGIVKDELNNFNSQSILE